MINKVILVGRLGKDPILRNTASGVAVATFSMATSESYKDDKGEWQDKAEWHNIVVWRERAETVAKYLKKGALVYVEGKMTTRTYEQEGQTKYITEIVASVVRGLEKRDSSAPPPSDNDMPNSGGYNRNNNSSAQNFSSETTVPEPIAGEVDDLPF